MTIISIINETLFHKMQYDRDRSVMSIRYDPSSSKFMCYRVSLGSQKVKSNELFTMKRSVLEILKVLASFYAQFILKKV